MSMVKFGFMTDSHFIWGRNNFRTDDFYKSVLNKFKQCYKWFEEQDCSFVIHGGDLFDKHKTNSFQMLLDLRDVFVNTKLTTYFIWGQHDLSGYNRGSKKDSSLYFLSEISNGKLVELENETVIEGIRFCPSHVDLDPVETLRAIKPSDLPTVAVVHALLYPGKGTPGTIDIRNIGKINAGTVLSGDLHTDFSLISVDGTEYVNPGSLGRTSREERKPKCMTLTFDDDKRIDIDYFYPECENYPFPDVEPEVKNVETEEHTEEYVQAFEKFKSESKDIFECLEKAGEELKIDKNVLKYILSKKGTI